MLGIFQLTDTIITSFTSPLEFVSHHSASARGLMIIYRVLRLNIWNLWVIAGGTFVKRIYFHHVGCFFPMASTVSLGSVLKHSLPYKVSPTPKLAAKRSANFLQIQFKFNSDLIYFRSIQTSLSIGRLQLITTTLLDLITVGNISQ
ncbi:hypothetical protein ACN38_g10160 [Penicillium nordicum]|uniref:Uncharacterized protein n=1 Tax=Penicillium nordicum TaxID=229535 RepID=A0A0M9WBW4_9EURO|nr:hypothetical protein ACN38_g10160 [Penicillium nordicum]